ncbi:myozenin-2b [Archocentrus centrarchus]|uniref:myozenin-2b n=1 Tax=Archocentrus centrarchus TaxID=63155 RepID=UPI0011EA1944|nr:myozenin-2-like [Archocentrus centrarchus]
MSQFCTMPPGERKKRAAAICQEVHGTSGDVMDLGKKLSIPKDIMLEELSLLSNRGSRLFKMRQRRSDKYTFESIQNEANALLNSDILNENTHSVEIKVEPPANGNNAEKKDSVTTTEKLNPTATHKSYHSPWEEALLRNPDLAETLKLKMPAADPQQDLPEYKCFNRVATPYGGFDKAPRGITFKLPEVDLNPPKYPELQDTGMKRPTFNRTAQGWISEGTHLIVPTITLEPIPVPESDDL